MEAIRAATERDAVFVGDVGVCNHRGANYCLEIYEERSYLIPAWGWDWDLACRLPPARRRAFQSGR